MFMVGGGILTHGIPALHHVIEDIAQGAAGISGIGSILAALLPTLLSAIAGIIAGAIVLLGVSLVGRLAKGMRKQA
jgi:hypothetical protein